MKVALLLALALALLVAVIAASGCPDVTTNESGPVSTPPGTPMSGSADAARLDAPAVPFAEVAQLAREAQAAWPASACVGPVAIHRVRQLSNHAIGRTEVEHDQAGYRCSVLLADGAFACRELLRRVLVHEFGHLAGREHSADPASPMFHEIDTEASCAR